MKSVEEMRDRLLDAYARFNDAENILGKFIKCAKIPIMRERLVFTGCLEVSQLILRALRKIGLEPRGYVGFVKTFDKKRIPHVWVEVDNYVIETNPSQIFGAGVLWTVEKGWWTERTKPRDILPFEMHPLYAPTPSGERFYNSLASEIQRCMAVE